MMEKNYFFTLYYYFYFKELTLLRLRHKVLYFPRIVPQMHLIKNKQPKVNPSQVSNSNNLN